MRHPIYLCFASLLLLNSCTPDPVSTASNINSSAFLELENRITKLEKDIQTASPEASPTAKSTSDSDTNSAISLQVDPNRLDLQLDQESQIKLAILTDENGKTTVITNTSLLSFSSSDSDLVTVSATGKIKALKSGAAAIQVKLGDAQTNIPVIVSAVAATPTPTPSPTATASPEPTPTPTATPETGIKSIALDPETMELTLNQSTAFASVVILLNPDDQQGFLTNLSNAEWSSSNESIVTVNTSGVVTGKAIGTATITVTYKGFTDTSVVTVKENI